MRLLVLALVLGAGLKGVVGWTCLPSSLPFVQAACVVSVAE